MPPERAAPGPCLRCGAPLGGGAYCAMCGQKRAQPLTFKRVIGEAWAQVAQLDTAFLRTLIAMVRAPGRVGLAYAQGDRATWTNPFYYQLLMATLFTFVVLNADTRVTIYWQNIGLTREQGLLVVSAWAYLAIPGQVPLAWVQSKLFARDGRTPAECFVFLCYLGGQALLYLTLYFLLLAIEKRSGIEAPDGRRPVALAVADLTGALMLWTWYRGLAIYYGRFGLELFLKASVLGACAMVLFFIGLQLLFWLHAALFGA